MSKKRSLLWEITKDNSSISSYLFGTMHTWNNDSFRISSALTFYLQSVDVYFAEYDLSQSPSHYAINPFLLPSNLTLKAFISSKKYSKIRNILLKTFEVDIDHFQQFYPILIINQIAQQVLQQAAAYSLDEYLWQQAAKLQLNRRGVETLDEQIQTLHAIPLDLQFKQLKGVSENVKKYRQQMLQIADIYAQQDLHRLYKITKKQSGVLRKLLIYNRNTIMAERIAISASQQPSFFAVGAGHLAGQKGILHLLKGKNFYIKPIDLFK